MTERVLEYGGRLTLQAPHVIHETIDGEVIVINLATGTYFSLRGSAAEAWELIQRPDGVDPEQLFAVLAERFDASPAELRAALELFVTELGEEGLVTWTREGVGREAGLEELSRANGYPEGKLPFEPPRLEKFTDMQDLVLLDPVHEVDDVGWPAARPDAATGA